VELLQAIENSNEGFFLGRTKEGTVVRAVFSRARDSGFVVAIGISERELLAPLRTAAAVLAATLAAVLALALAVASRVSRRIASSAAELAAEAVQIGKSTQGEVPRLFFLEADQVRLGIKIATAELQQSAAELQTAHAEQEAVRLADLFALVEAAMEPMLVMDGELAIRLANEAAQALLQRPGPQLVGMKLRDVVWGTDAVPPEAPKLLHAFLPDGSRLPVRINRSVITIGASRYLVLAIKQLADAGG
jgi:PAS domain-containing protein